MTYETQTPIAPAPPPSAPTAPASKHWGTRGALLALTAFMAIPAIAGAIWVVPAIPNEWLHNGVIAPFTDPTVAALALGILCGGSALVAFAGVLLRPTFGALASMVAGIFMIGFEVVEILVVGFTPVMDPANPVAWLQIVYLIVGGAITLLGLRLWLLEAKR